MRKRLQAICILAVLASTLVLTARAEVILQYFNTSWKELEGKMPELAEVGYGSLWLPPPTKGSGALSVGYDMWDPFDIGGEDQRNTIATRYGTQEDLIRMIETAHRFGIRVYFDNIMNHRAFDVPGFNENTPIDVYPGMVPEDFHLRVTEDGFYRKWDNVANWQDAWQVQNRNFSDLIDIAQENGDGDNANHGVAEGYTHPKISFVRHPNDPDYYDYHPTLGRVGFNSTNITTNVIAANESDFSEYVNGYLNRAVRWLVDVTKVDGLRLDAVKHVPSYFFGDQGAGKDTSNNGYTGTAQDQFNLTRGFSDSNHRDTVFDSDLPRDDLMMFGEHLGSPPGFDEYTAAGMRLVDATLKNRLNGLLGQPGASLSGLDQAGASGDPAFNQFTGVMFAKSHDDDYASRPEMHYAFYLTRQGLPNIYTDGNYQSETLAQSGGAFPRHANTAFLGQFGDSRIPNLVYIHNHFARGDQVARWADEDIVAYERRDKRENTCMSDTDGTVLFFVMNDNFSAGEYREIATAFPAGAKLWQYSSAGGGFYYTVPGDGKIKVITPPGGYFAFSWRSPEPSDLWSGFGGDPVTIYQNDEEVGSVTTTRRDGPDGDPAFNPYGVDDPASDDFQYSFDVPRVTSGTNLRFVARVDGSAIDVLMKLDGGVDINSHMGLGDLGEVHKRDNPPGIFPVKGTDMFLGYENSQFKLRQHREKFAAVDSARNQIGSAGAETYVATIGTSGFNTNQSDAVNDLDRTYTAEWVFHDPDALITASNQAAVLQFSPEPGTAGGGAVDIWAKIGYGCDIGTGFVYYTTDGVSFPEGAGGEGYGNTEVAGFAFIDNDTNPPDGGSIDWWKATLPAMTNGTPLRYKIGFFRQQGAGCSAPFDIPFPNSDSDIARKTRMMGVWEITNFNATTATYTPHIDYGNVYTGLVEGFHVLNARAFLQRDGAGCGSDARSSIYNTFVQSFYYDTMAPTGAIVFPASDGDDLLSQEYGLVIRTDPTVEEVWCNVQDNDPLNDDAQTGDNNGNGTNAAGEVAWAPANAEVASLDIDSPYPEQWRYAYRNIPASGMSTIECRLVEVSSDTNLQLSAEEGHFGSLIRVADALAPTQALSVAFPATDNETIGAGYVMKAYFSKSLADGIDEATLISRFLLKINGSVQPQSDYSISYNEDGSHHALSFTMPDLFNGDVDFLHSIEVTHTTGGGVTLQASRVVKAQEVDAGPFVSIVSPPEVDGDGQPFVIVLPDVGTPMPTQREYSVQVETDLDAQEVWIEFQDDAATAVKLASIETKLGTPVTATMGTNVIVGEKKTLTGAVWINESNLVVNGVSTDFTNELAAGDIVCISTNTVTVTQLVSDTQFQIATQYLGPDVTNAPAARRPAFDMELSAGATIKVDTNFLTVVTVNSASNVVVDTDYPGTSGSGFMLFRVDGNPNTVGSRLHWNFLWTNMTEGFFTFHARVDTNGVTNTVEASATRNTTVIFREIVNTDTNDFDDDDDGLPDLNELNPTNLPSSNPETWDNGQVHIWYAYGKSDPLSPDTDGDGLPDGLESGWRGADTNITDTAEDTNGDGFPNFISDQDPPFFNTLDNEACVPGVNSATEGGDRAKLVRGSMTDPNNADSDYDGLPDGIEDWNRNGWVDGDGDALGPTDDKCARGSWPDGIYDSAWTETDPNDNDTDNDGSSDGWGEDKDFDGLIAGDSNSNRNWEAGELWAETDPLNPDTDGDGLPDGWETQYALDPHDDGIAGHTNMNTGAIISTNEHGADGNPDNDFIVVGMVTNPYNNLLEFQNGTNPRDPDTGDPPPEGSITIGPGPELGVINGVTNYQEFTDWTKDDLIVLDEYEGDGPNNQQGDLYLGWDGWDDSRDMVAFYARDGGPSDGKFYFRVDFHDLQPLAEEGNLDLYVVIDTGNPASGEMALADEVDAMTSNRWEVLVALYQSNNGRVFVDLNPALNSTAIGQDLSSFGVEVRDTSHIAGFKDTYFNATYDAVEFSISRTALTDGGWNGLSISSLNFQVFSTKDGTCNSCKDGGAGDGDIGGRNDIRDSIFDDDAAEDYWQNQPSIKNALGFSFNAGTFAGCSKVSFIVHENEPDRPGSFMQDRINTGLGAGYHRTLAIHEVYEQPVSLHVTPTWASAVEWAKVDPIHATPWRDGPSFNDNIATLIDTNVAYLMGSTFSDHILPYFTKEYNRDNERLARDFLDTIYETSIDTNTAIFWTPQRVLDEDVFEKIDDMGYSYTVIDQMLHMREWLGRTTALSDDGYRINKFHGVHCFIINDQASSFRFENYEGGLNMSLRRLFSRKARSGTQDQVVNLFIDWDELTDNAKADAYDVNLAWMANRPWIEVVSLEQIAKGEVDVTGDGAGDFWFVLDRGTPSIDKIAHDWVHHSTEEDYDNWYVGSAQEESLQSKIFMVHPTQSVGGTYGMMFFGGIVSQTWDEVQVVGDSNISKLARAVMHASTLETAFHDEDNQDLTKFSTGDYIDEDTSFDFLAKLSKDAQSQTRLAAILERVDDWVAAPPTNAQTAAEDIDLDGQSEYLLYNDRLFAVFERLGGRIVGAWVRNIHSDQAHQVAGNMISYANSETEEEGTDHVDTNGTVIAHRTSLLKDWFTTKDGGANYVNVWYDFIDWTNGWRIVSVDSNITKTVTLDYKSWAFETHYQLDTSGGDQTLYIRNGLSPNLYDLLLYGQAYLSDEMHDGSVMSLVHSNYQETVTASIGYNGDGSHSAEFNQAALDDDPSKGVTNYTINMRNQAQTHQVELFGTNDFTFSLEFRAERSDFDADGIPNVVEDDMGLDATNVLDGADDDDGDGMSNAEEYVSDTDHTVSNDFFRLTSFGTEATPTGVVVRFDAKASREYTVLYTDLSLVTPSWSNATPTPITVGADGIYEWHDSGPPMTFPNPLDVDMRNYRIDVGLPR